MLLKNGMRVVMEARPSADAVNELVPMMMIISDGSRHH